VSALPLDVDRVRKDFPIFERRVHGKPLVYLDSAASAQKPRQVIETISDFYARGYASIHRGVYSLADEATRRYEAARATVQRFLGAADPREIVFVRNATEAVNLVACSWGRANLREGDEIVLSEMEHHSNIVPWQLLREQVGAVLRVVPIDDRGDLELGALERAIGPRTKLVALAHVSNSLGTVNPAAEIVRLAHERGVPVLLDGAQAVPHMAVDVGELDCDFYVFSGHKVFGPTGIGVLWGRLSLLEAMPPWQGGGSMIERVTFDETTFAAPPQRFEAGTPHVAGAIGLAAALDYVTELGMDAVAAHERALLAHATAALAEVPGLRVIGTARHKASVLSFVLEDVHPHDIGTFFDREGVAIRAGHHCAQPVMDRFGVPATARASFALYNTREDVEALVAAVYRVKEFFA
jgi:cysteine desulfurase / selenocysteine lyase